MKGSVQVYSKSNQPLGGRRQAVHRPAVFREKPLQSLPRRAKHFAHEAEFRVVRRDAKSFPGSAANARFPKNSNASAKSLYCKPNQADSNACAHAIRVIVRRFFLI